MPIAYIVETRKGTAGIVVRDGRGFRFFAATQEFSALDGKLFATPRAAEAAASSLLFGLKRPAPGPGGDDNGACPPQTAECKKRTLPDFSPPDGRRPYRA